MKTRSLKIATLVLGIFLVPATLVLGQGSLTPPGPPAPTMKPLDQVEPRTAISYAGYNISSSGSYYVTTNLTGSAFGVPGSPYGITISADNVTVDIDGFTLQGVPGSYSGIHIFGSHTNIIIRNGVITGWGNNGIDWNYPTLPAPQNITVKHLTLSANGVSGVVTANGCLVSGCSVQNNHGAGIFVDGDGSQILDNNLLGNNSGGNSGSGGIIVEGNNNRIEGNHVTLSGTPGYGIAINFSGTTGNVAVRNSVVGNGANNYGVSAGNDLGPVGTAASSTSPWANFSH